MFKIYYKIEGCYDSDKDTEEEAREEFYELTESELMDNSFVGAEITDIE